MIEIVAGIVDDRISGLVGDGGRSVVAREVVGEGCKVGPREQLTPSRQEVMVMTLVVNKTTVDFEIVLAGNGTTVGG